MTIVNNICQQVLGGNKGKLYGIFKYVPPVNIKSKLFRLKILKLFILDLVKKIQIMIFSSIYHGKNYLKPPEKNRGIFHKRHKLKLRR